MAQQVEEPAASLDGMSSVPGSHIVEGKQTPETVLWFPHTCHGMCGFTCVCTYKKIECSKKIISYGKTC